eukprot:tig00021290_g19974.t1
MTASGFPACQPSPNDAVIKIEELSSRGASPSESSPKGEGDKTSAKRVSHRAFQEEDIVDVDVGESFSWSQLLKFLGPGFLVSIAYIDPGNIAVDLAAGAQFGYTLAWVLIWSTALGLLLQTLSSRLGLVTGRNLAQKCRDEYPRPVSYVLWLLAELAIIAADIPEVVGTAFALKLLFGIQLWVGVLITGLGTFVFLALQRFGVRKLEACFAMFIFVISACFVFEMFLSKPDAGALLEGTALPRLDGDGSMFLAVSLLGAVVMPHNLYLHSALVQSRRFDRTNVKKIRQANLYNLIESGVALAVSCVVNIAVLAVAAARFFPSNADDITLEDAHRLLGDVLHSKIAPIVWAVGLLASGQSSCITGTFAGQYVMEGFVEMRMRSWIRNAITRGFAIVPSLAVALTSDERGSNALIIFSSVLLSFQLPFALLPLLKFVESRRLMGQFASTGFVRYGSWVAACAAIAANLGLVCMTLLPALPDGGSALYASYFACGIVAAGYIGLLGYLMWRPVTGNNADLPPMAVPAPVPVSRATERTPLLAAPAHAEVAVVVKPQHAYDRPRSLSMPSTPVDDDVNDIQIAAAV